MNALRIVGRWIFGLIMVAFGVMHISNAGAMAGMVPNIFPGGAFWVYFTGIAYIATAISFFVNQITMVSSLLLALLLLIITLSIEVPMLFDPKTMQAGLIAVLKNSGLIAGLLFIAADHKRQCIGN